MVANSSLHCGREAQGGVESDRSCNAVVERNRGLVIRQLHAVSIGETGIPADQPAHGEVLAFHE